MSEPNDRDRGLLLAGTEGIQDMLDTWETANREAKETLRAQDEALMGSQNLEEAVAVRLEPTRPLAEVMADYRTRQREKDMAEALDRLGKSFWDLLSAGVTHSLKTGWGQDNLRILHQAWREGHPPRKRSWFSQAMNYRGDAPARKRERYMMR